MILGFRVGELVDGRYRITSNTGRGVFSSVVKAIDTKDSDREIAIKVIRSNETMYVVIFRFFIANHTKFPSFITRKLLK